jgi:hypothetical protein
MTYIRRLILALVLLAGSLPAFAQVPAAVPALPDTERRTSYSISASTCACAVNFALYGDSTDYQNWVEVFINGTRVSYNDATYGWTITTPSGSLSTLARPITNAVLTFNAVQTGTVQIVGARRPRRTSQFNENTGVSARNLNQVFTDIISQNRELWDKTNDVTGRAILSQPGDTLSLLPTPAARASTTLGFDALGQVTTYSPASAVTDSANITFLQSGTGAVSRTAQSKMRESVSVLDFDVKCDGVTNDHDNIVKADTAAAAASRALLFPGGTCLVGSAITPSAGARWIGSSLQETILKTTSATANILTVSNSYVTIENMQFQSSVVRSAGWFIDISGSEFHLDGFILSAPFEGIRVQDGASVVNIMNGEIDNTVATSGVSVRIGSGAGTGPVAVRISDFIATNSSGARPFAHLLLVNSGDLTCVACQLIQGGNNVYVSPGTGQTVASLIFIGGFIDQAGTNGVVGVPTGTGLWARSGFYGTWISGSGATNLNFAPTGTSSIDDVECVGCKMFGASNGVGATKAVGTSIKNIKVTGGVIAGATSGVNLNGGDSFNFQGTTIGQAGGFGVNTTGITLAGTITTFIAENIDVTGSTTALTNGAATTTLLIRGGLPTAINTAISLAEGGSNNSLTAVNGGVVWSDATKLNISAAGAANAFMTWGGAGVAPKAVPITGLVLGAGASAPAAYAGTSCTNQFPRSLSAAGVATCASVANTDLTNSSLTIGTTAISLGGTSTVLAGLTSVTDPLLIGGTAVGSSLELRATSGVGAGAEFVKVTGGNSGATEIARFLPSSTLATATFVVGTTTCGLQVCFISSQSTGGIRLGNSSSAAAFDFSLSGTSVFLYNNQAGSLDFGTSGTSQMTIVSTGATTFKSATASTSITTGTIILNGASAGIGLAGAIYAGAEIVTGAVAVASLPTCNAAHKAARHFVTDANAAFTAGIGAVVAAGGANNVPVTCDGTNWRIGSNDNLPAAEFRKLA